MHDLANLFKTTLASGLRRQSISTPSKWAREYRVMGPPFPGAWSPDPAPWTLAMHDSEYQINIGQKAAQMGFSETVLNITFFKIDIERKDCFYVLPTKTPDATEFSSARFDTALELSGHLGDLFSNVKNVGHKRAGSANLYVRGSNSRSSLKSVPVAVLILDEVDEMNQENIPLAEERTSGQPDYIIWKISTPTIPNRKINKPFLQSTQDHWIFKCLHCSKRTELIFPECLVITAEISTDPRIKETHLICKECKHKLDHETKRVWLGVNNAEWVPFGDPQADIRGFYINQLYSIPMNPWEIAKLFLEAQSDKASEQEFYNSKLGLPHVVEGSQLNELQIQETISGADRPYKNTLITMGVDQGKWLHYEIAAWRFPTMANDLNMRAECQVIKEGKCIDFEELDVLMKEYQVVSCVIDAQPEKRKAFEFACRFFGHVKLCYYAQGQSGKMITIDSDENQHKITVDRTTWLDTALNRFRTKTISLPKAVSQEYQTHLINLVRRYDTKNDNQMAFYVSLGADHFGHARAYNEMALPLGASLLTNKNIRVFL